MVILGTEYAGEMKKGIFSVMHYLMPKRGVLSLHSGCNIGHNDDVSLFFGLSGDFELEESIYQQHRNPKWTDAPLCAASTSGHGDSPAKACIAQHCGQHSRMSIGCS
jgi:Phosphoenolpyruvate carboxykinase